MFGLFSWFLLLTAAALCYPRRPRLSGALFIVLGGWSIVLRSFSGPGSGLLALGSGAFWVVLGVSYLVRFRSATVRAEHIAHWTAKA
jgi:hypothetical protein